MDKLDKTKSTVGLDKDGDPKFCEDFASSIFNKADKADRAGKSDKTTVATFYASKVFFDVCLELCLKLQSVCGANKTI